MPPPPPLSPLLNCIHILTRWALALVAATRDVAARPSILTWTIIFTGIVNFKIFTLCGRIIIGEAGAVWEWTTVLVDHLTNTMPIAVVDTRIKTFSIAGYVTVGTIGTRVTDTLITTRCKVVTGAIIRAGVGRTGSCNMCREGGRERGRETEREGERILSEC